MKQNKHYTLIEYEDLTAKLFKGKYSEYRYLSPRWGYKRAYKHNQQLYICLTSELGNGGWIDVLYLKNANRLEIIEALKNFKETSRRYKKLTGVVS